MAKTIETNSALEAAKAAQAANSGEDTTGEQTAPAGDGEAGEAVEKKLSPKNKLSRGIDPSLVSTWVDFNSQPEVRETLVKAAKVRGVKIVDLLRGYLEQAVDADKAALQADADKYEPPTKTVSGGTKRTVAKKIEDMTPEEAQTYVAKQQQTANAAVKRAEAAAQAAQALLAQARAKATGTPAS